MGFSHFDMCWKIGSLLKALLSQGQQPDCTLNVLFCIPPYIQHLHLHLRCSNSCYCNHSACYSSNILLCCTGGAQEISDFSLESNEKWMWLFLPSLTDKRS